MTIVLAATGTVFFIAIGYRFITRMTKREPAAYRVK
jgi:hypothetical protein